MAGHQSINHRQIKGAKMSKENKLIRPATIPYTKTVNAADLIVELESVFKRYVVLPEHAETALSLWTLASYLPYKADGKIKYAPRVMIISPTRGCGKSVLLSLLSCVCERPLTTGNISSAALYRIIESNKPLTPLIDEYDSHAKGSADMANILNNGFMRGYPVIKCSDNKGFSPEIFDCFTPVAVAGISKRSFEPTTIDRSIIIQMRRKRIHEHIESMPDEDIFSELRQKCAKFIQDFDPGIVKDIKYNIALHNRRLDVWGMLLGIAKSISEDYYNKALKAAIHLSKENDDDMDSADVSVQLLSHIRELFMTTNKEKLTSEDICNGLKEREDWPWAEMGYRETAITPTKLSALLRDFKIKPHNIRTLDSVKKGYIKTDFLRAWESYLEVLIPENATPLQNLDIPE